MNSRALNISFIVNKKQAYIKSKILFQSLINKNAQQKKKFTRIH